VGAGVRRICHVWRLGGKLYSSESGEVLPDGADDPMRTAMRQMAGVFSELERRSLRQIAAVLDTEGHKPKRSERWHPQSLSRIVARL
jgi:hypothetical protein